MPLLDTENQKQWFNILIVYAKPENARRPFHVFQRLMDQFGQDFLFAQSIVAIDKLDSSERAEQARDSVAEADLILVSIDDESELTERFKVWTNGWRLNEPNLPPLLAVMLENHPEASPDDECPFLHTLAQKHGMDFLCEHSARSAEIAAERVNRWRSSARPLRPLCRNAAPQAPSP